MTHRSRALLDLAHEAPCMLLLGAPGCGADASVPCHSDMLAHGRGAGHKSHDCLAVAGCPACHAWFTRERLGREGYAEAWAGAFGRYQVWLWETGHLAVLRRAAPNIMAMLTPRQREVFDFIKGAIDAGLPPTRSEIAEAFGYRSPNAAEDMVNTLCDKGVIEVFSKKARGIRLV